jgi:uncharacterized protein YydD (DUF2326 family)
LKKIEFISSESANFLSIGKEPVIINFIPGLNIITGENKDKPDSKNGVGKCVDPSTLIDIIIEDKTVLENFIKFISKN